MPPLGASRGAGWGGSGGKGKGGRGARKGESRYSLHAGGRAGGPSVALLLWHTYGGALLHALSPHPQLRAMPCTGRGEGTLPLLGHGAAGRRRPYPN